jgi:hypothetical protein
MKFLLIILIIILIVPIGSERSHGGCNVKPPSNTPKPNVHPAPQKSTEPK